MLTIVFARFLGLEFLPKLEEGNLWIRATLPPTISLQEGNAYVNEMRKMIRARPEVESVVSQHGRPDDGTDAAGLFNAEFFAPLKPASEWPGTHDKEELTAQLLAQLQDKFPGVEFNFSQYLQDNVSEAVSGVKGENSIKLYGNDLQALTDTANKIKSVLATVQGVTDLAVFTSLGQPTIQIDIDRARAARYGLSPGDINATIKVAVGGDSAGDLYEPGSDRHFPIIVRLAPEYRKSAEAIQNLRIGVAGQGGAITQIPLSEVASINLISGAAYIYREQQERYLPIKFSVRDRDLGSAIQEAQDKVAAQVQLPPGSRVEWVGEFGNLQDAIKRLSIVVPISLALIGVLLFFNFGSMVDTLLAMSVIPMAIFGGVLGLLITGIPFSVSAAIGFIALFGIAVMDGIIILSQYNQLIDEGYERMRAVIRTGELQLRPVLMTCVVAGVGLLPAALSEGIGSQVQKPLAVVVVTGMMLAPIVILVTLPVLISYSRAGRGDLLWAHAHVSCPLGLWLTRSGGRPLIPAGTTAGDKPCGSRKAKDRTGPAERPRAAGEMQRRPPSKFSGEIRDYCRADAARPNRPSGGWWSMMASWYRGCATVLGSRPVRSTRSALISRALAFLAARQAASRLQGAKRAIAQRGGALGFSLSITQKYLLFVSTCSEKTRSARISLELGNLQRRAALRIFDAESRRHCAVAVMRAVHARFRPCCFMDVWQGDQLRRRRLMLEKYGDCCSSIPHCAGVINLDYAEALWLTLRSVTWHRV